MNKSQRSSAFYDYICDFFFRFTYSVFQYFSLSVCWNLQFQQMKIFADNFQILADNFSYYRQVSHVCRHLLYNLQIYSCKIFIYIHMKKICYIIDLHNLKICRKIEGKYFSIPAHWVF